MNLDEIRSRIQVLQETEGLTIYQEFALPVIEWLISEDEKNFGTGRTTILCHAFIRKAIRSKEWVRPFDHHAPWDIPSHMRMNYPIILKDILERYYPDYQLEWKASTHSFRLQYVPRMRPST